MGRWFRKRGDRRGQEAERANAPGSAVPAEPPVVVSGGADEFEATAVANRTEVVRTPHRALAHLAVLEGPDDLGTRRFRVSKGQNTIGRSPDCDISLTDPAISRVHAVLIADEHSIVLEHHSQTNETFVNGVTVRDRQALCHGDQLQFADRVVLQLEAPAMKTEPRPSTLRGVMEARVDLERRIEQDFVRDGSFLDVDVVDSYGMKQREPREDHVVVSFERFRSFVERKIQGRQGRVLNSNGDEVMAYFDTADTALASARDLLAGLRDFNSDENLLGDGFKIRVGIHSGRSAVDLESGIAYSPVLDGAGHLQKDAPIGGALLSDETYQRLSDKSGLRDVGALGKRGIEAWVLDAAEGGTS